VREVKETTDATRTEPARAPQSVRARARSLLKKLRLLPERSAAPHLASTPPRVREVKETTDATRTGPATAP
jgi:hypothetical protein